MNQKAESSRVIIFTFDGWTEDFVFVTEHTDFDDKDYHYINGKKYFSQHLPSKGKHLIYTIKNFQAECVQIEVRSLKKLIILKESKLAFTIKCVAFQKSCCHTLDQLNQNLLG